jgi:hypothetical protein
LAVRLGRPRGPGGRAAASYRVTRSPVVLGSFFRRIGRAACIVWPAPEFVRGPDAFQGAGTVASGHGKRMSPKDSSSGLVEREGIAMSWSSRRGASAATGGRPLRVPWRRAAPSPDPAPDPDPVSPALLAWAQALDASRLSDRTVKAAEEYLRDHRRLNYETRREFGYRLRSAIEAQVSPAPPSSVASVDVIARALSARRKQLGIG